MHPSNLPDYAGGSPIQNQIVNGVTKTKATLFRLSPHLDRGNIVLKDDLDLSGSLSQVFDSLTASTVRLFIRFEALLPNLPEKPQGEPTITKRRLQENDSLLTHYALGAMKARDLYNFIRCRENVEGESIYPNAYYEDGTGRVLFEQVRFIEPKE